MATTNLIPITPTLILILIMGSIILCTLYFTTRSNEPMDEYALLRKYILNDTTTGVIGKNGKPILWIHTKYEKNARQWKTFYSRNSMDLNQPYLHLTVKSILNHCAASFQVCLIDDASFSKLVPTWTFGDLSTFSESRKTYLRKYGMALLIYTYGGLVVPNSFLCQKDLIHWMPSTMDMVVVAERRNRCTLLEEPFVLDSYFLGATKHHDRIREYIEQLKTWYHIDTTEIVAHETTPLDGVEPTWWRQQSGVRVIPATQLGIQDKEGRPIDEERWLEEDYIDVIPDLTGVYLDEDYILGHSTTKWLAAISIEELFASELIVVKYMKSALLQKNTTLNV